MFLDRGWLHQHPRRQHYFRHQRIPQHPEPQSREKANGRMRGSSQENGPAHRHREVNDEGEKKVTELNVGPLGLFSQ